MKRLWCVAMAVALLCAMAAAQTSSGQTGSQQQWQALGTLRNAQYVYVTSYDGPEFSQRLLPGDRTAIANVQNELQQSGRFFVVYEPWEADVVMVAMSRPSEDVLDVYAASSWPNGGYLWRGSEKNGLTSASAPLVRKFEAAFERAGSPAQD